MKSTPRSTARASTSLATGAAPQPPVTEADAHDAHHGVGGLYIVTDGVRSPVQQNVQQPVQQTVQPTQPDSTEEAQ